MVAGLSSRLCVQWLCVGLALTATLRLAAAAPTLLSPEQSVDCSGVPDGSARNLDCGCELACTPTAIPVYIFSNVFYPVSTVLSSQGQPDISVTLADEYKNRVAAQVGSSDKFGGIFDRLSGSRMKNWNRLWGDVGRKKTIVIAGDGTFVGAWSTELFLKQNAGFVEGDPGTIAGIRASYNTYKDRIITLPNGVRVKVIENATASPLIVDLDGDGVPSLLAGSGWSRDHVASFDLTDYRPFRFGGGASSSWEWIGGDDGLLVWLPTLIKDKPGDSRALFGTDTWGKSWKNGFEALGTLDKNRNGLVDGDELQDVGVWRDVNGDAIAQGAEVSTAIATGISAISHKAIGLPNTPMVADGVDIKGESFDVWDWWSARNPLEGLTRVGSLTWVSESVPSVVVASFMELESDAHFPMLAAGNLELYQDSKEAWFVRVIATTPEGRNIDLLYPATPGAGMLRWGMKTSELLTSHGIFEVEGKPAGITAVSDGRFATWRISSHEGATPWR